MTLFDLLSLDRLHFSLESRTPGRESHTCVVCGVRIRRTSVPLRVLTLRSGYDLVSLACDRCTTEFAS